MMAKATTFRVEKGRGGKDFTPAHRKTDSRLDGGNSLHGIFKAPTAPRRHGNTTFALPLLSQNLRGGEGNSTVGRKEVKTSEISFKAMGDDEN